MNRKTHIALIVSSIAALIIGIAGPSNADGFGFQPKPDPSDSRVITQAGNYSQQDADANKAAYDEALAYADYLQDGLNRTTDAYYDFAQSCVDQLSQRDQKYADDMNARWAIMQDQKERIYALEATVDRKNAKIAELRAKIRQLQGR